MKTRCRPGSEMWQVMRAPLVPMGSFTTWTRTSSPSLSRSWICARCLPLPLRLSPLPPRRSWLCQGLPFSCRRSPFGRSGRALSRLLRRLGDRGHFGDGRRALGRLRKRLVGRLGQVVGLEGIALDGACLDVHFLGEAGEGGVGNDVADVEEGCLVEADVDERGLHAGEHPDYPSFIDVPDYSFLVLPLQVVLRDRPLLDQRHPGLLTRGVDHEDVGHRKILLARSRGYRATAAGRPWGAAS